MIDSSQILKSTQLPTLPTVAVQLVELSRNPNAEIREVVSAIRADPAITARILKATNSAYFGLSSQISSIDRAVPLLGTTVVTSLALTFSLDSAAVSSGPLADYYKKYWTQSVVQASAAEMIAPHCTEKLECEYFLIGLLLDIGRLAMLKAIPADYGMVVALAFDDQQELWVSEQQQLGVTHSEIGAQLMKEWGLHPTLISAVRNHHLDCDQLAELEGTEEFAVSKVATFIAAVGDYFCWSNQGSAWERIQLLGDKYFGLDENQLLEFLEQTRTRIDEAADLFSIDASAAPDVNELMAAANAQLAELAMRQHVASTQVVQEKETIERENQELRKQTLHDSLTKIYNRRFFDETLNKELSRCCRAAKTVGVVFADIDHFKQLNDTYGHQFGDEVLVAVAESFRRTLREADVLARYGGEEFVVLLYQPSEEGVQRAAERMRSELESMELTFEGQRVPVTASLGAVIAFPSREEKDLAEQLLKAADEAMYEAKQAGRNRVTFRSLMTAMDVWLTTQVKEMQFSRWLIRKGVADEQAIARAVAQLPSNHTRIGELAVKYGFFSEVEVGGILREQSQSGERFGETAIRKKLIQEKELVYLLAIQQEDPRVITEILGNLDLLTAETAELLLEQYLHEQAPLMRV